MSRTYLNCGELAEEAIDASAERPGNWGKDALWWRVELCVVEVEEGLDIGSSDGSECLSFSSARSCTVFIGGRSSREEGGR